MSFLSLWWGNNRDQNSRNLSSEGRKTVPKISRIFKPRGKEHCGDYLTWTIESMTFIRRRGRIEPCVLSGRLASPKRSENN